MSIKGPLTYAGFLITHIENASVFLLTSYVTGALSCAVSCAFSVGPFHSGTKSTVIPICVYLLTLP